MTEYISAIQNITQLLKEGGHIVISGVLGQTFYRVGDFLFKCFKISAEEIRKVWEENGFKILEWKTLFKNLSDAPKANDFSDFKDVFAMLACKVR